MEPSQENNYCWPSCLQEAIASKNYIYLEKYLAHEPNIYTREVDGLTPLQIALQINDIEMVRFLLEHKADPNQNYLHGYWENASPLHFALASRSDSMVILLIEYGADVFGRTPTTVPAIFIAIQCNRVCVLRYLMDHGVSPKTLLNEDYSLLAYAVMKGHIKIVKCILEHKPDLSFHQHHRVITDAIYGCSVHSKKLVRMLYRYGFTLQPADIDHDLIEAAVNNGHYEAVQNLLKLGIDPNFEIIHDLKTKEVENILHLAVRTEKLQIIQLLLKYGANVQLRDANGKTPILIAAEMNNLSIIRLLLRYKADVTDTDLYGCTVLHLTIMECIKCLYNNLNSHMNRVKTKIVKLFVSKGANVNAKKYVTDSSPLDFAAWIGIPGVVQVLLAHGAQVDTVNYLDMTPLKYARREMAGFIDSVNIINHPESFRKLKLSTLKLLEQHVHRLYRIGLPVCLKDLEQVDEDIYKLDADFSKTIDDEIKFIKETKIGNCQITLFRFLTSTDQIAARLIRNEVFFKSLKMMLYHPNKFPEYAKLIRKKLTVALTKKKLDKDTFKLINFFFEKKNLPLLPNECIEQIVDFLSDEDKKVLISQFAGEKNIT